MSRPGVVPFDPIDKGLAARMKPADAKVYLVLCAHADANTLTAYPGVARLAELTGYTERAVQVALDRLRGLGAIVTEQGGGRNHMSKHRLLANPESPCALSTVETLNGGAPFQTGNPERRHTKGRTAARETLNHGAQEEETEKKQPERKNCAADKPPPDPRVKEFIDSFCQSYQEARGKAYIVTGSKDGATVKRLLAALDADTAGGGLAELKRAALAMLADHKWGRERASIGLLSSQINTWRGNGHGKRGTGDGYANGF
jgi:DNA-binding transcriptional ArsR family regulator